MTVQRVAAEHGSVEVVRGSGGVVRAVDVGVVARRLCFSPAQRSRQLCLMLAVVDEPVLVRDGCLARRGPVMLDAAHLVQRAADGALDAAGGSCAWSASSTEGGTMKHDGFIAQRRRSANGWSRERGWRDGRRRRPWPSAPRCCMP